MKKLISFVMAAVLCVGMTTTVLADGSPTTKEIAGAEGVGTIKVSSELAGLEVKKLDDSQAKDLKIESERFAKEAAREAIGKSKVKDAEVLGVFDVKADVAGEVKFENANIKAGDKILVLHYNATTKEWENVTKEVGNGYVIAKFNSFSPVAIVEYTSQPASNNNDSVDEATSPKTADVAMFGLYAAVALAGTVTAARKAKASK